MPIWFYITLGILVNCVWGTAFLIPYYLSDIDPIVITLGRYLVYGIISVTLVIMTFQSRQKLTRYQWQIAFVLAFTGNIGYYAFLTSAIHYGGITLPALIIGILPITMIIAGNFIERSFQFSQLTLPIIFISAGIVLLNVSKVTGNDSTSISDSWVMSLGLALIALVLWTTYGVLNSLFLKKNSSITSQSWSSAIGVCCFIQGCIGLPLLFWLKPYAISNLNEINIVIPLIIGCVFLGIVVSWLATIWWNQVSRHIPITIAGQLIVFETISSLIYGYIIDQAFPSVIELVCAVLIIIGVYLGIKLTSNKKDVKSELPAGQGA